MNLTRIILILLHFIINLRATYFIDIQDIDIKHHTGNHTEYYKEYRVKQMNADTISFPLNASDSAPIVSFGQIKLFFTSAIEGNCLLKGQPIIIPDSIDHIVAIRGRDLFNHHRFEAYIGLSGSHVKKLKSKVTYQACLLVLQFKNTQYIEERKTALFSNAQYLTNQQMASEVKKYIQDPNDMNWQGVEFTKVMNQLIPKRPEIYFHEKYQLLISNTCYWSKNENKLKGIIY